MNDKTFNRNVCFTFFESYLSQAELIKEQYDEATAYRCLSGIAKYALYQEEPDDVMARIVVEGLKNAIDAGQTKRSKGFKEDVEMTNMILRYKADNPDASYRKIADALGCSRGKVGKVLTNSNIDSSTNSSVNPNGTSNPNTNTNSSSNSNYNSVDVDTVDTVDTTSHLGKRRKDKKDKIKESEASRGVVDTVDSKSFTSTDSVDAIGRKNRRLDELSDEELDRLTEKYKKHTKYAELYDEFGIIGGCLDKNLIENVDRIKNKQRHISEEHDVSIALGLNVSECEKLARKFGTLNTIDGVVVCVNLLKERMDNPDKCDVKDLVRLLDEYEYGLDGCNGNWDLAAKDWERISLSNE